ncbi:MULTISPECIES: NUDIX domain-containing protein [Pseudomonas]|uniref:NUDIX hydrolase n=1 Tax=Pseudomonas TaxID=286 RepID=UPI001AE44755|nr:MULTISPECIES: NUDIX domain-containing protein [Pseudomonas]MBP2081828.1 8-oxo-dGTP diphosphatase [Pseudomonas sp. PvP089]MBP2086555.1 8-oxo-dGTP diphosphatase [Pseudomonas sp. PvP088]MBP2221284.1 8-oxo-dGTP diphosphatase [Pseudomonas putida]
MKAMDTATAKRKGIQLRATIIYRKDGEVLFVRKRNAKWNLPGGRVERDETPHEAAMREMAEETGLAFDELRYLTMYREDKVIHYLFEARKSDDKPRPRNEIEACRWIKARDVPKRRVRRPIKTILKRCA